MKSVRFLRERDGVKVGEVVLVAEKGANELVKHGYGEIIGEETVQPPTDFKTRIKDYLKEKKLPQDTINVQSLWSQYLTNKTPEFNNLLSKPQTEKKEIDLDEDLEIRQAQEKAINLLLDKKPLPSTEALAKAVLLKWNIVTLREDRGDDEMYIYQDGIYKPNAKTYIAEFVANTYGAAYNKDLLTKVISKIVVKTYVRPEDFFDSAPVNLIPVENGIVNLYTTKLMPFTPTIYFQSKLPIKYEEEATCNNIIQFYNDVLRNKEDVNVVQEFYGYCLQRDYRYPVIFMCLGTGSNGKSKHLEILRSFLGNENCTSVTLQDMERDQYSKAELAHKLANIAGDIGKAPIEDSSHLKAITGGDLIKANRKHMTQINFVNYAKIIYSANELPPTYDTTEGFFRRWKILDFPHKFYKPVDYNSLPSDKKEFAKLADPEIVSKLITKEELSGLLNWALAGLQRLNSNRDFSNSQTIIEIEKQWLRRSNSFYAFVEENIIFKEGRRIVKSELRNIFSQYCKKHKTDSVSDKVISITLEKHGVTSKQMRLDKTHPLADGEENHREWVWEGMQWKNEKHDDLAYTISKYQSAEEEVVYKQNTNNTTLSQPVTMSQGVKNCPHEAILVAQQNWKTSDIVTKACNPVTAHDKQPNMVDFVSKIAAIVFKGTPEVVSYEVLFRFVRDQAVSMSFFMVPEDIFVSQFDDALNKLLVVGDIIEVKPGKYRPV